MSINPATDIVLDVARAADPARYKRAVARLDAAPGAGFVDSLAAAGAPLPPGPVPPPPVPPRPAAGDASDRTAATYRQFEAMALANLLQAAVPSNEGFFGKGVAGDTWKSMLIDQIAAEMAKHGGVGIAQQLTRSADLARAAHVAAASLKTDA
jgi:hypothetical protein